LRTLPSSSITTKKPTYSNYYPGSVNASDITAFVIDDPDAVF